jgi:hypothetical protein
LQALHLPKGGGLHGFTLLHKVGSLNTLTSAWLYALWPDFSRLATEPKRRYMILFLMISNQLTGPLKLLFTSTWSPQPRLQALLPPQ